MTDSFNSPINGLTFAPEWAGTNIFMACQVVRDCSDSLYSAELGCIGGVADKRRNTFSTGRSAARAALAEAGLGAAELPRATDGSVIWPAGITGSVTHTDEWAVAAVAVQAMSDARSLGIDLERIKPLEAGVLKLIATENELAELLDTGKKRWHATALFGLKESLYKCLRPSFGRFIEFHDVEIIGLASGRPHIRFNSERLRGHCDPTELELRMAVTAEHVFSMVWQRDT